MPPPSLPEGENSLSSSLRSGTDSISSNTDASSSTAPPATVAAAAAAAAGPGASTATKTVNSPSRRYVRTGIGGKGNYRKMDPSLHPPTSLRLSLVDRCKRPFRTGIGGAGNRSIAPTAHGNSSSPAISPTEHRAGSHYHHHQHLHHRHASGGDGDGVGVSAYHHVGIGGSGNRTKRDSIHTSQSEAPLLTSVSALSLTRPDLQYSDKPLQLGAADRLAAKLFGYRR